MATRTVDHGAYRTAASTVEMRSGCHFAQFTVLDGDDLMIRADWDVEEERSAVIEDGHCFYSTYNGDRWPDEQDWEGMQTAKEQGDRIGMLLDLDQGSMTVWKNGEKLGVMQAEGLTGPLCWAVDVSVSYSVRIESTPAPESPTAEELAAAKAWPDAQAGSDDE